MGRKIPDGPSADMDTRKELLVVLTEQRIDDGAPRSKGGERVKISPSWRFETGRNAGCSGPQKAGGRLGGRRRSRAVRCLRNCLAGAVPRRGHPGGSHIAESIGNASGRRGGPYDLAAGHPRTVREPPVEKTAAAKDGGAEAQRVRPWISEACAPMSKRRTSRALRKFTPERAALEAAPPARQEERCTSTRRAAGRAIRAGRAGENGRGVANSEPRGFPPELCRARPEPACVRGSALGLQKRPGSQIRGLGGWE